MRLWHTNRLAWKQGGSRRNILNTKHIFIAVGPVATHLTLLREKFCPGSAAP